MRYKHVPNNIKKPLYIATAILMLSLPSVSHAKCNYNIDVAAKMHSSVQNTLAATAPDNPQNACLSMLAMDKSAIKNPFEGGLTDALLAIYNAAKATLIKEGCKAATATINVPIQTYNAVRSGFTGTVNGSGGVINGMVVNAVQGSITGVTGNIINTVQGVGGNATNTLNGIIGGATGGTTGAVQGALNGAIGNVTNPINNAVQGAGTTANKQVGNAGGQAQSIMGGILP